MLDERSKPTPVDDSAPMPICRKPSRAAALPTFLLNGASAIAAAFGNAMPQNGRYSSSRTIFAVRPYQPNAGADHDHQHDDVLADQRGAENLAVLVTPRQPDVELAAADETAGEAGEDQPVGARIDMKGVDENDRRAGHVDEQAGKRESATNRIGVELRQRDDVAEIRREWRARPQRNVRVGLWPSGKKQPRSATISEQGEAGENDENPWPADRGPRQSCRSTARTAARR